MTHDVVSVLVPAKALLVAFVIALPYVLYQVWAFVAPGLYVNEKRLVLPLVIASSLLFLLGMSFAYFLVSRSFSSSWHPSPRKASRG